MSIFQQRVSVVTDTITTLNIRISEPQRLRDQVREAQLSARRSRPKSLKKEREFRMTKAASSVSGLFMRLRQAGTEPDGTILALSRNRRSRVKRPNIVADLDQALRAAV